MRIDRMLSITVILLNKERVSARDLAEKFEVSIRTIYRDIEAINLAGIPVISYQGNNGDLIVLVGLFQNPVSEYFIGTGLRYLNIPVMSIGVGLILNLHLENRFK